MADRGIIYSAPMVRALIDGRKTQTRRLITAAIGTDFHRETEGRHYFGFNALREDGQCGVQLPRLPYAVGDRLYVREAAWIAPAGWTDSPANPMGPHRQEVAYKADDRSGYTADAAAGYKLRLRPSIHMPRWASRITQTVTEMRVQRLQDISEADAIAEGIEARGVGVLWGWIDYQETNPHITRHYADPRESYRSLWNSLHTKPGTRWEDNPWVVAVTFDVKRGNIDAMGEGA